MIFDRMTGRLLTWYRSRLLTQSFLSNHKFEAKHRNGSTASGDPKPRTQADQELVNKTRTINAVPECSSPEDLAEHLLKNVLLDNEHIVAVNKPNGLHMGGRKTIVDADLDLNLSHAIPLMREKLGAKFLSTALGINGKYSGVILLAKSKEVEVKLKKYYTSSVPAQRLFPYTFRGITVGQPQPSQSYDKLIVMRKKVGSHVLTYITEHASQRQREFGNVLHPHIKYEVLDWSPSTKCAFVEFQTSACKWDVLPVHIVTKLATVLGDHDYSSRLRSILGRPVFVDQYTAVPEPQLLPKIVQMSLKVEKEDIKTVPVHLHLKRLVVPKLSRNSDAFEIVAPLPAFFLESLDRLCLESGEMRSLGEEHSDQRNELGTQVSVQETDNSVTESSSTLSVDCDR